MLSRIEAKKEEVIVYPPFVALYDVLYQTIRQSMLHGCDSAIKCMENHSPEITRQRDGNNEDSIQNMFAAKYHQVFPYFFEHRKNYHFGNLPDHYNPKIINDETDSLGELKMINEDRFKTLIRYFNMIFERTEKVLEIRRAFFCGFPVEEIKNLIAKILENKMDGFDDIENKNTGRYFTRINNSELIFFPKRDIKEFLENILPIIEDSQKNIIENYEK